VHSDSGAAQNATDKNSESTSEESDIKLASGPESCIEVVVLDEE
jgi:hypothetical protein